MPDSIDAYLGIHTRALVLESRRMELLAGNLANADTPGFKARDLDFRSALAAAGGAATAGAALRATQPGHRGGAGAESPAAAAELKYRVPLAPALDGNTVDAQLEQSAFAANAVRYQATLTFINGKLRSLLTAITGQ
ncbi:MAG: flagellar basal body rod protein FlgB [Gammaproteobacteria bacterium]|nr:flagellar basal body rod protein FlgB [Gammaproteobacteria bacterium]